MVMLAPSILSSDFTKIGEAVRLAEDSGADIIHIDIMDGHFVPNLTLGPQLVASLRKTTNLPIDVHLMVENPRFFVPLFHEAGADWISIHVEATSHLHKDVTLIRDLGRKAGIALNPGTPISTISQILDELDFILLMSVNPGWGGQQFIPSIRTKIRDLKGTLTRRDLNVPIQVDGGIKVDNVESLIQDGMEIIVSGSAIFEDPDPASIIKQLKDIARRYNP
jgi:ribulose-phosphate 3-epimerase